MVSAVEVEVGVEVVVGMKVGMKAAEVVSVAVVAVAVAAFEFGVGVSIPVSVLTDSTESSESPGWVSANAGRPRGGQPHFHSSAVLPS